MNQVCILFHLFFETGLDKLCLLTELGWQNKSLLVDNEHIGKNSFAVLHNLSYYNMLNCWDFQKSLIFYLLQMEN